MNKTTNNSSVTFVGITTLDKKTDQKVEKQIKQAEKDIAAMRKERNNFTRP